MAKQFFGGSGEPTPAGATAANSLPAISTARIPQKKADGSYEDAPEVGTGSVMRATSAQAAAVAALTVGQSTDIIARIGLMEYIVANDFNPALTGIAGAPIGARASTVDVTTDGVAKAWTKFGVSNRQWVAHHLESGTLTTPAAAWDIGGLAGNLNGGFEISMELIMATGANTNLTARVNGGTTNLTGLRLAYTELANTSAFDFYLAGVSVASLKDNDRVIVRVKCHRPAAGVNFRVVSFDSFHYAVATNKLVATYKTDCMLINNTSEITSIGVLVSGAGVLSGTSTYQMRRFPA